MEKKEWSEEELRNKAARYCATAEHCESEVREKLRQWGGACHGDAIIDYLYDHDYLNTARYCGAYVHDKIAYQGWGRIKIRAMLRGKGLPESDIRTALENTDEIEYNRMIDRVLSKKKGATPEEVTRFGLQRGFEYERISDWLSRES